MNGKPMPPRTRSSPARERRETPTAPAKNLDTTVHMPEANETQPIPKWVAATIVVLVVALAATFVWFASGVHGFYRTVRFQHYGQQAFDADQIQSWMTFRYVGFVFHLPPSYLGTQLQIAPSMYQDQTLGEYAAANGVDTATFVQSVKAAVSAYQPSGAAQ